MAKLELVFEFVKDKADRMVYWRGASETHGAEESSNIVVGAPRKLSKYEEYLLTLIRLRRGVDIQFLSDLFAVSHSTASRIIITWVSYLYHELHFLLRWPDRQTVTLNLPTAFKYFPKTRAVIDCTEFFIQRPSMPSVQRKTWSSYKHHNTVKFLVAITPAGRFCFVSKAWSGNVSDRKLVQNSGFLEYVEAGDDIMADRGFLIRDLLALRGATVNIPPFSNGKQLTTAGGTKTRRIAQARIHVERAIGRLKLFKILQGTIPLKTKNIVTQTVHVCAALCNLDKRLVK